MREDAIAAAKRDLIIYGTAIVYYANINGKLVARRLDPRKVDLRTILAVTEKEP